MTNTKTDRNKDLVKKRLTNPKKWTWGELGKFFGVTRHHARDIFDRHVDKFIKT